MALRREVEQDENEFETYEDATNTNASSASAGSGSGSGDGKDEKKDTHDKVCCLCLLAFGSHTRAHAGQGRAAQQLDRSGRFSDGVREAVEAHSALLPQPHGRRHRGYASSFVMACNLVSMFRVHVICFFLCLLSIDRDCVDLLNVIGG